MTTALAPYRLLTAQQKPPRGSVLLAAEPLARSLAVPILLNEGAGQPLGARSGTRGVLSSGVAWTTGPSGPALTFNGTSGDATFTNQPACGPALSVVTRVRFTNLATDMMLVERSPVNSTWELFIATPSTLYWRGASSTDRVTVGLSAAGIIQGSWLTIGVTDTGSQATLYVQGVAVATNNGGSPPARNANAIHLGSYDNTAFWFNGAMAWAYVYEGALSARGHAVLAATPFLPWAIPAPAPGQWYASVPAATQNVLLASDVSAGSWTTELGSSSNLYTSIDEAVASDADYIQSGLGTVSFDSYRGRLTAFSVPVSTSNWTILLRSDQAPYAGAQPVTLRVRLYLSDGTTLVHDETITLTGDVAGFSLSLTSLEAAMVTQTEASNGLVIDLLPVAV